MTSDLPDRLRDNAHEWDISECPQRAEIARRAADRIEALEAEAAVSLNRLNRIRFLEGTIADLAEATNPEGWPAPYGPRGAP